MKYVFSVVSLCLFSIISHSQINDFEQKYNQLIGYIVAENWGKSEKAGKELLAYVETIDSMQTEKMVLRYISEKMVLRYIYIYSTAGLLNTQKLSKEEALKKVIYLKGKEMTMPAHPFNSKCYVNCIHLADQDPNTFFSGVNNSKGTQIFSFEYVKIKDAIKETSDELEGKFVTLSGELNEITVEGNIYPRFRLKFINGSYKIND